MTRHCYNNPFTGILLTFAILTSSCSPSLTLQKPVVQESPPDAFPLAYYRESQSTGSKVLRVDPDRSLIAIVVRRDGALARLGHDHVVASHHINGFVDISGGRADLYLLLEQLDVDETALRQAAGFTTQPSEDAIAGTRLNMLGKVLESSRYPYVLIRVIRDTEKLQTLSVTITLHGTEKTFEVPAQIKMLNDDMEVNGLLTFNQSDFGLTPFSILGGAIRVHDRLELTFRIVAKK